MLSFLKDLLSVEEAPAPEAMSESERVRVATCVLLLEVAKADDSFTADEQEYIVASVRERFGLSAEGTAELLDLSESAREESFDLWKFTHALNEACSMPEKQEIIEQVWRVIYADGVLDAHEDYLVHKLAKLLNLKHSLLIEAKMKVLNEIRGEAGK